MVNTDPIPYERDEGKVLAHFLRQEGSDVFNIWVAAHSLRRFLECLGYSPSVVRLSNEHDDCSSTS